MSNKVETKFIDTSKEVKDMMIKLAKTGLREVGKDLKKKVKAQVNKKTGALGKAVHAKVEIGKNTKRPSLLIGFKNSDKMAKKGIEFFPNPYWFEFGVKPHVIMTKSLKNTGKSSYQLQENGKKYGVTVQHPGIKARFILRNTVFNNIDEIRKIEEVYLKQLTDLAIQAGANIDIGGDEEIE